VFIVPVGEGTDGDGHFHQTSWLGGAEGLPLAPLPVGAQQPVHSSGAQAAELVFYLRGQCQFTAPLKYLDQFWEEGLQPAGAHPIAGFPGLLQSSHHF
jgi:hypothetical protein